MTAKTKKINYTFSHLVIANNNAEYEFVVSEATDHALKRKDEFAPNKDVSIEELKNELAEFVASLPLKSKMIRRFQRFDEDADEFVKEDLEEILSNAMLSARSAYAAMKGEDEREFSDYLITEINSMIDGSEPEDRVSEWSILSGIEDQVKAIIAAMESHYDIQLDKEDTVDHVMDECDRVVNDFVKKNDKSTGLDIVSRHGENQFFLAPLTDEIDDGHNKMIIPDFEELGLGGMQPDNATLNFLRMAGVTPMDIIKELREEMDHETLMKWNSAAKEDFTAIKGARISNLQDALDIIEHCGDQGGIPVYVTELLAKDFIGPVEGDEVAFEKVGLTMIPSNKELDTPGLIPLEDPVQFSYEPSQIVPATVFGIDPLKESSLKIGELISSMTPTKNDLDKVKDELLEIQEDLGM